MKLSLKSVMKPKMAAGGCMGPSCQGCMGPNCMSEGGEVKGVHKASPFQGGGTSEAGQKVRASRDSSDAWMSGERRTREAKDIHKGILSEMKSLPKPKLMAEGGEVMDSDMDMDGDQDGDESEDLAMQDACAGELLDALERKDKAGILEAMRAIILSVR